MWSPELHSPFPTIGISIVSDGNKNKSNKKFDDDDMVMEIDIDATRAKLDAIFQSMDANRDYHIRNIPTKPETNDIDHERILHECLSWYHTSVASNNNGDDVDWTIQTNKEPYQLYKTLWNTILTLAPEDDKSSSSSSPTMVVVPSLDSHTLHRVAVTVNAALIRLNIPVRVTQLYTPSKSSPYGIIQLSPIPGMGNPETTIISEEG
jgi:hypothetical protein